MSLEDSVRRTRLSLALVAASSAALVGVPAAADASSGGPIAVQLVAMNDFHGRISETASRDSQLITGPGPDGVYGPNPAPSGPVDDEFLLVGGAAHVTATVDALQASFTETTGGKSFFVGAGDLISASTFESSFFKDEPTIEALNAMGLDVSAVGNHEYDRGTEELRRISGATDGTYSDDVVACPETLGGEAFVRGEDGCFGEGEHEFHGTDFPYLAANVISTDTGEPMLPPYQILEVGGGRQMAVIGVVTESTPTIVSPGGIADVEFIDEADAVNRWTRELEEQGIRSIAVLVHEGGEAVTADPAAAYINSCENLSGPVVDLNARMDAQVDLIISAHTHQAYNCLLPVPGGEQRLVTQAGFYGRLVTDIRVTIDPGTGDIDRRSGTYGATNVPVQRTGAGDTEVASIVTYWNDRASVEGNVVVGSLTADMLRGARGAESSLGNLVAQAQLEAMQEDQYGRPVIAFMNPGGLRADLTFAGSPAGEGDGNVTYRELFDVQPFGNTVNAVTLTGADIEQVLEEQFQLDQARGSQLILGTSEGFRYSYDLTRAYGDRVIAGSITLNGTPIDPAATYRVAANSFLIGGGDAFTGFTNGLDPVTGPFDVDSAVQYFRLRSPVSPPPADHATQIG
jgi:5'-nucleotidase